MHSNSSTSIKHGSCLCGAVKYQVCDLLPNVGHCHCKMCRKFHGAAFSTFGEVASQNFSWLSGETNLQKYVAHNGSVRQFCRHCGSSLTFQASDSHGSIVEFSLGTLDSHSGVKGDAHIFTESKADWFDIHDDLPQYKTHRDGEKLND